MLSVFHACNSGFESGVAPALERTRHKPTLNAGMYVVATIDSKRLINWHEKRIPEEVSRQAAGGCRIA
jgi:hypothetical protein